MPYLGSARVDFERVGGSNRFSFERQSVDRWTATISWMAGDGKLQRTEFTMERYKSSLR